MKTFEQWWSSIPNGTVMASKEIARAAWGEACAQCIEASREVNKTVFIAKHALPRVHVCWRCGGDGRVLFPTADGHDHWQRCTSCDGRGTIEVPSLHDDTCARCGGTGTVEGRGAEYTCPLCNGSGHSKRG